MILIVTNRRDLTTDYVVRELEARRLAYVRLNTDALAEADVVLRPDRPDDDYVTSEGQTLRLAEVTGAYFRRPETPIVPSAVGDTGVRDYCAAEWSALLKTLLGRLEGRWFNEPAAIMRAEDKPRQLLLAHKIGFRVPATTITNQPSEVRAFVAAHASVAKPLRQALIEEDGVGRVVFTARIDASSLGTDASIAAAPVIVQAEVPKAYDVRVTIVGTRAFATAIHSQVYAETTVDWRKGVRPELSHEIITLPPGIESACIELTHALGLRFGAIDLVCDPDGQFWFLEINPNGQWAWIEQRTGHPIAAAIVDDLAGPRR